MEQQSTTSNIAAGDDAEPETNEPQQQPQRQPQHQMPSPDKDAQLSLLKPELLCVGFVGLIHNPFILVILLFEFIVLSIELDTVIKWKNANPGLEYHYHDQNEEIILRDVSSKLLCIIFLILIVCACSVGAIVMDVYLRGSTYLVNHQQRKAKLQTIYLIVNIVYLVFGLTLSALMFFLFGSIINLYFQFGILLSHCLRAVCIFVVFQSWAILRQTGTGVKNFGGFPVPLDGHNQASPQTQSSIQVQEQRDLGMKQQSTTSNNIAAGETVQPVGNTPQQSQQKSPLFERDMLLSFLKPELLSVGILSLFNNLCLSVFLLYYFISWSYAFDQFIKKYNKDQSGNHTVNGLMNASGSYLLALTVGHLIGFLLAVAGIVMDVFLRRSTILGNIRNQKTKLRNFIIVNMVFWKFAWLAILVIFFEVPFTVIPNITRNVLIMSNCLRTACIFVVYKYWTLLPGFGFSRFSGNPIPVSGNYQNQFQAQAIGPLTQKLQT